MTPEHDKQLTERFPFFQGAHPLQPFPMFGIECGDGWFDILWRLCLDLEAMGWQGYVTQVKEKFGGLRFYVSGCTEEVLDRIDQAEGESLHTCEVCGQPGTLDNSQYWVLTLCPTHMEERHPALWATPKEVDHDIPVRDPAAPHAE